ncbi:uncharacterized protein LOC124170033 [Ischnura elegans]|uniref:uncharacterized protein LOC124170033 n=1 Tax=Ischnura elegans TaxID=197161 RepID=UPI001ED8919E|nr:uncharacterized protein LOC124170033 [Ischnura elegans]
MALAQGGRTVDSDEKHSVESTGTCQVRKDDRHGNGKKGRSEDRHSSGGKAVERSSDAHKPKEDDRPSKTPSLPKEKAKIRDKKDGPSTTGHAQRDDDRRGSRMETSLAGVAKLAEELGRSKEGHASKTTASASAKERGKASERRGRNKDEKHSVESTGTCQVRKDDRHGNGKKGRSEDRHSSGGKAVERSSDAHKPKEDDRPSKTPSLPKEKAKVNDKKGNQSQSVPEMTSRGSKVKDVGTGKTSAGHNRSQDWERKASLANEDDVVDKADAEPSGKKHNDGRHEDGNRKRRSKDTPVERPSKVNRKDAGSLAVGHAREVASGSIRKGNNGGKCVDAPAGRKIVDAAKSSAPLAEVAGDASRESRTEQSRAILTNQDDSSGGLVGELRASNALNDGVRSQRHRKSGHKSLQRRKKARVDMSGPESGGERVRVVVAGTVNYIEVPVTRDVIVLDKGETSSDPLATIKTEPVEEEAQRPSPNIQRQLHSKGPIYDSVYSNLGPVKSEIVDEPKASTPTVRALVEAHTRQAAVVARCQQFALLVPPL